MLVDKEKVQLYYVGLPFRQKWKQTIHIFLVGHRSTGLPECGPTESSAPEPCLFSPSRYGVTGLLGEGPGTMDRKYYFYSIGHGKSSLILCGPPISFKLEMNYVQIFMVNHKSTSLPKFGPTEYRHPNLVLFFLHFLKR